ncbi:hypothetical protein, partial [Streptomyces sp. NPDC003832]
GGRGDQDEGQQGEGEEPADAGFVVVGGTKSRLLTLRRFAASIRYGMCVDAVARWRMATAGFR